MKGEEETASLLRDLEEGKHEAALSVRLSYQSLVRESERVSCQLESEETGFPKRLNSLAARIIVMNGKTMLINETTFKFRPESKVANEL